MLQRYTLYSYRTYYTNNCISLSHSDKGLEIGIGIMKLMWSVVVFSIISILNEAHFRTSIDLFLNVLQSMIIINVSFVTIICVV